MKSLPRFPSRPILARLAVLTVFAMPMASLQAQAVDSQRQAYDIPAGPLDQVLNSFARRAGVLLSFDPSITRERQTAGLAGRYTVTEGFSALLSGSGLQAVKNADGSYALTAIATAGSNSNAVLPTVTITESADPTAPYAGGLLARGGSLGVLGTASVMDTPFSTTNYTSQGIEDVQARAIGDVIANDASVRNTNGNGGFGDSYQIRGFTMSANDVAFNGLYGMVPLTRMPIAMVERIEVLKGPGTLMYGMGPAGGIGGAVNLVAKRAHEEPISSVTATYLSNSQFGLKGDIGRRFGDNQEWGVRVNALYADGNTGLSGSNQQQSMGSIGLDYNGSRVRWSLDAYTQHEDARNFRPQFSLGAGLTSVPEAPSGKTNLYPGNTMQSDDKAVASRLEYDINDTLTAYGAVGYHVAQSAQNFPRATITTEQGATSVTNGYYDQKVTSTSADVGLRTRFNTGAIKHTLIAGANMLDQQTDFFYKLSQTSVTSNLYNPAPLGAISFARGTETPQNQVRLTSFALTDTVQIFDDRLRISAGLRRQQIYTHSLVSASQTSNKTAISPVLAVVVKPLENLSLYANYTAALTSGGFAAAQYANAGQAFAPSKSKQYETGAKIDWGRVTTTAALFQIEQKNGSTEVINGLSYATQDGRARIRGLELAAYGEIQRGLRFNASGTFFDTQQSHTAGGATDGKEVGAVPNHNFNLGLDWDTPWVTGLALNTRIAKTGSMWYNNTNALKVPGWTRADIGARYISKGAAQVVTYRANIENLFDKNYWVMQNGYVGTASGRTFVLSAQVDF